MSACCKIFFQSIIMLIGSILLLPAILLLLLINLLLFILRVPFYLYHKCKYQWCYSVSSDTSLPPATMGFTTKLFYLGPNPCYNQTTLINVTLYLNKHITKQQVISKASFLYQFSRFRYIPYRSWLTGISEFSHSNDTDQIIPTDISPHIHIHNTNPCTDTDDVQTKINEVANIPLNRNIPWWDIHIIDCNEREYKSVLVFRCSHCLGDGATFLKFVIPRLLSDADGNAIEFDIKPRDPPKYSW